MARAEETGLPSLQLHDVTKLYGAKAAVRDLNLSIEAGDRVAILGRNGAGKTTMLRLALGLARPTRGTCRLFDLPPDRLEALRRIGYSPQANMVPGGMRVREIIRLVCAGKGVREPADLIERLEVAPLLRQLAGGLSPGQRRRLTLVLAFLGEPELVILDEPTVSLDGASRETAWQLAREFTAAGGTLLLGSHDFNEVAGLTERVLVFVDGELRADSTVTNLARSTGVIALEIPRTTDLELSDISYVVHRSDRTILLTRKPDDVLHRIGSVSWPGEGRAVLQRRPTVEEVCLALGGGRGA